MTRSDERTREQLLMELDTLRERVAALEASQLQPGRMEWALQEVQKAEWQLSQENALLARIGRIIFSTLEIEEVYEQFASEVGKLVDFDRMSINRVDREAGVFTFKYLFGQEVPGRYVGAVLPIPGSHTDQMLATGQAVIREDLASHQEFDADAAFLEAGLRSSIAVPLGYKGQIIGALSLWSRRVGAYGPWEQATLQRLADQIAPAIQNAQLYAQARSSEEALRESEELFRSLMEAAADAFIIHDLEGRIVDVNQMACDSMGYAREELLNLCIADIYPLCPREGAPEWKQMVPGVPVTVNAFHQRKDGTTFPTEIRIRTFDLRGQRHVLALARDITERQAAEAALRELAVLEERNRLARELHDSVTQSLYSLTLFAEAGRRLAQLGGWEQVKEYLAQLGETSQQALKEMRLLVHELRPLDLEKEGLLSALQQRLDAVEGRAGVEARLLVDGSIELPPHLEDGLYRIAQEALNNSLKHSSATVVTVRMVAGQDRVELEIEDNGRGFDPETQFSRGGMGLVTMRERIKELGGSLDIISGQGKGTRVVARVAINGNP